MQKIGLVGLGVMGENLALNIEEKGFPIAVYNRSSDKVEAFVAQHGDKQIVGTSSPAALVAAVERPRKIIMMVKAGPPVDDTIAAFRPHLEPGDILVDGGNEHFRETERRERALAPLGLHYVGMGVSGGEEGARNGPSMMPGGSPEAYAALAPILTRVAAQVEDGPCVDHMGPGGAGHYVKMVHNGIEYGDMQLIAESYDLLKNLGSLTNAQLADVFTRYNEGELESFLVEITATIFRKKDPDSSADLIDVVVDASGMKGTGKWTVQEAAELAAPAATIATSVEARIVSALRQERQAAAAVLPTASLALDDLAGSSQLVEDVRQALYCAKICSYAQGMNLLRLASDRYEWNMQLGRIARIWKGGCIIRAQFLGRIQEAYARDPQLGNLLVDEAFAGELARRQPAWRRVVSWAVRAGIPVPALGGSLAYFDSYRRERLPANLIQAQRDLFGAHTYERRDKPGTYHSDWKRH